MIYIKPPSTAKLPISPVFVAAPRGVKHFRVADGNPANGFVHITARLRIGRARRNCSKSLGEALLAAADKRLANVYPTHPIGLTVEIYEKDP